MRIKKYIAKTFQEGKLLILEELGEDAVILSSRTTPIDSNGESNIEIIAGINEEANASENTNSNENSDELQQSINKNNSNSNSNIDLSKTDNKSKPNNINELLNSYRKNTDNNVGKNTKDDENNESISSIKDNITKKVPNDLMSRLESLAKPISNIINKIEDKPSHNSEERNKDNTNKDNTYNDYSRDYLINNRIQESYSGKNISNIDLSFITTTNADLSEIKKILRNLENIERYKNANLLSPTHQRLYSELIDAEINVDYALEILGVATQNLYKNIQSHLKTMIFESVSNFNKNKEVNSEHNTESQIKNQNYQNSGFGSHNIFSSVNDYTLLKREITNILTENLSFGSHLQTISTPNKKQQRIIFVGPSGSGKTSALIKLAIVTKLLHNSKILIVSADSYKVGGVEQLQTLSAIASINFKSAFTNQELQKVLLDASEYEFVFIDTSGKSPNDPNYLKEIKDFMNISQPTTSYLVQNATTNYKTFKRILENFSIFKISGLILSKIDETESIGNILYLLKESKLNLSYFTNGQQIPDDMEPATASKLLNFIFKNK